jgi:prevent-host-death family protein
VRPRAIPMREAKDHLPSLVRQVARGARLTISVHGRPQADLVPHVEAPDESRPPRPLPVRVKLAPGLDLGAVLDELREDAR